jgi:Ca-activated chloride channel family protein
MKKYFSGAVLAVALASVLSCAQKKQDAWVSPADDVSLARLEAATLERNVPKDRRARLFFLWGQELAAKGEDERAIGAFERVVDIRSGLVDESRFNLEILWRRERERKQQDQKNQQSQQEKQKPGDTGDDQKNDSQKKDGQSGKDDKQDKQDKNGRQSDSPKNGDGAQRKDDAAPKDLSGLVRDREQSSDLDKALKAELERRNEKQQAESGGLAPVEKDW